MIRIWRSAFAALAACWALVVLAGCPSSSAFAVYRDQNVDFGLVQSMAIMPLANLSKDDRAGERVRDVLATAIMGSSGIYVIPAGEVNRGIAAAGITNPSAPSKEEIVKFASVVKVDAVITGVVREYGEVRSATISSNVISLSLQMLEGQGGRVIWSASSTEGGVDFGDRLLGGGGEAFNSITEEVVEDLLEKLFD